MANVLFVQETYFPFQSVAKLSAHMKSVGHDVCLSIGESEKVIKEIREKKPDLIAFSILTPYRNHMLEVSSAIKAAGIDTPIIAGGYDISFTPEIVEHSDVDIICRGEGEQALEELCDMLDSGSDYTGIANLWVKKDGKLHKNDMRVWAFDLDAQPFDDRDLYLDYDPIFSIFPFTQVIAGRGCPYQCTYCFNDAYRKIYQAEGSTKYCNYRSPDNVIDELKILKNKYKAKFIFFNDSTLTYNKKWLLEFLPKYASEIGLPMTINAVITELNDEIAKAIKDTGVYTLIRWGLETGNEEFRIKTLNKRFTNEQMTAGVKLMQKYDLNYSSLMMLGLPGETLDMSWETLDVASRIMTKGSTQSVGVFSPFPGLPLTDVGIKLGQYEPEDFGNYAAFNPHPGLPVKEKTIEKNLVERVPEVEESDIITSDNVRAGTRDKCRFFGHRDRRDPEFKKILLLSRFAYLAIRFPRLKGMIKFMITLPDNILYRMVFFVTKHIFSLRVHGGVTMSFIFQYYLFHRHKKMY